MKKSSRLVLLFLLLFMALFVACGKSTSSSDNFKSDVGEDNEEIQQYPEHYGEKFEKDDLRDSEEESSVLEETQENEKSTEKSNDEQMEQTGYSEELDIQIGSIGTVEMTVLSYNDSISFAGKEMNADAEYLEQARFSEVYYCKLPIKKIEVHPIKQWSKDYSSYTISSKILGEVEDTEAEEPFRIYDVYPEGIPINCVVFYLNDGSCGTFSLGYSGSGEEHSWNNKIYNNIASMDASREKEIEEGAVNAILFKYEDIIKDYANNAWTEKDPDHLLQLHKQMENGVIPQIGKERTDENGVLFCDETETHFMEIYIDSWSNLGIARLDLNNDGTEELIIGNESFGQEDNDQPSVLLAAYSVKNGTIQTIFHGWSRSRYYLADDGCILHVGSGGYLDFEIIKNNLVEDSNGMLSLKETESVIVDGRTDPERPYFYYPEGRTIIGYDDNNLPIYSSDNVSQMDENTGREYYDRIFRKAVHVDLKHFEVKP